MEATRIRLAEGVHLTYLPARKFKTSLLSAQFVTPLRRERKTILRTAEHIPKIQELLDAERKTEMERNHLTQKKERKIER